MRQWRLFMVVVVVVVVMVIVVLMILSPADETCRRAGNITMRRRVLRRHRAHHGLPLFGICERTSRSLRVAVDVGINASALG